MDAILQLKQALAANKLITEQRSLARNEHLKLEGSVDTNLYFVTSGTFRVYVRSADAEHCLYFGYEGSLISALDSFLTGATSEYCIQALRSATVEVVDRGVFEEFVNKNADGMRWWNQVLTELLLIQRERERDLLEASPAERYQRALKRHPQLFQHIPHKFIASYLRMTPETFSRIQKS